MKTADMAAEWLKFVVSNNVFYLSQEGSRSDLTVSNRRRLTNSVILTFIFLVSTPVEEKSLT